MIWKILLREQSCQKQHQEKHMPQESKQKVKKSRSGKKPQVHQHGKSKPRVSIRPVSPSELKEIFSQQIRESYSKDRLFNYFTFNGKDVILETVKLWEIGSLCSKFYFEKDDQIGRFLPVFRYLKD